MKKLFLQIFQIFFVSQAVIFLLAFFLYKELTLVSYINMSFYVGSLFIFFSLLLITTKGGFFDTITKSFRLMFLSRKVPKEEIKNMLPLSQLVTINVYPYLLNGIMVIGIMLIALYVYYI